jgi:hypothetical protein
VRRLFRILLTTVTFLSVFLAGFTGLLWVRSTRMQDQLSYLIVDVPQRTTRQWLLWSDGRLGLIVNQNYFADVEQFKRINPEDPSYARAKNAPPFGWSRTALPRQTYKPSGSFWNQRGFWLGWPRWKNSTGNRPSGRFRYGFFFAPYWFLLLLFSILPALALRRAIWTFRRRKPDLCAKCGYDLRASPERCPECGMLRQVPDSNSKAPV